MQFIQKGRQFYIGKINTSDIEIRDLFKAWIAISIAFAMVLRYSIELSFYQVFIIASITVGTGFLLHELGHKFVAQRYGCFAEFRSFDQMLLLAIIMSFFGFVFAAPGAVMIHGPVGVRRNGKISIAGPLSNIILALIFLALLFLSPTGLLQLIASYGYLINSWLALFNMIPFWNFDGKKVLAWNKFVYFTTVIISFALILARNFFITS